MSEKTEMVARKEHMPERTNKLNVLTPLVDIFENDTEILLHADMPGVPKEEININIDNGRLEISGTRQLTFTGSAAWQEFSNAEYRRVFSVPQTIDIAKVNAELRDGVLHLHLPKSEKAKPRVIEIKAG